MARLTIPQQNIWNLRKYYPGTSITNICCSILFREDMNEELLKKAIWNVVKVQGGLRLQFKETDGTPNQKEVPYIEFEINSKNFENEEALNAYADSYARVPFVLNGDFLFRFEIIHVASRTGILLCVDHLIADAWTVSLLAKLVYQSYKEMLVNEECFLENYSYTDVVKSEEKYMSSTKFQKDQMFWNDRYQSVPDPCSIRPLNGKAKNPNAARFTLKTNASLTAKIRTYEEETTNSPAVLFETAVLIYLSKINRDTDNVSIGSLVLNRSTQNEKNTAGMFISTIPFSVKCSADNKVKQIIESVASTHRSIFRHQKYPLSLINEDIRKKYNTSFDLYDVIVSYQNAVTEIPADTQWYSNGYCEVPLEVHIDDRDQTGHLTINYDYQTEIISENEMYRLSDCILGIIEQILDNDEILVSDIFVVSHDEKQQLLDKFNDTCVDMDFGKCVHELFGEKVRLYPNQTALVFEQKYFTNKKLDDMSNSLAHFLRSEGVGPNIVVPIISRRSWHVIIAMLGILKAGGAYMLVDPTYPSDRIDYMFETAECKLALTYGYDFSLGIKKVSLEAFDFCANTNPIESENNPGDLCYIIFTSGSTGKPKGVSITHKNVVNYCNSNIKNVCSAIIRDGYDTMVSVTNFVFDIFVTESLLLLLNSITIYMANDEQVFAQSKLADLIRGEEISVIQTTPTKMRSYLLDKENISYLKNLNAIMLGGEAFPKDLYEELRKYTAARIFNIYGPAETTVWSTIKEIFSADDITIGKPIANTQIYILDRNLDLLPIGIAGELCIAGEGVGKGYQNRSDLTSERFVKNPYATTENRHGEILYRTGDLARWREDGEIEYLGRIDTQVKIRGLRIELAEIESIMATFDGIRLVAVTDKRDASGRQYLVGYYTAEGDVDEKELRRYMGQYLPRYMVPNYFMCINTMPMTASGKTDRKNLPDLETSVQEVEYILPVTANEKKLAKLWKEILVVEQVGRNDDFFELGGDSLQAISLIRQIEKEFRMELQIKDIYECSELESMAERIEKGCPVVQVIESGDLEHYELLPQQLTIYSVCRKNPFTTEYNVAAEFRLEEPLDKDRLQMSLDILMRIHRELSTSIELIDGKVVGRFNSGVKIELEEYTDETVSRFIRPFDLGQAPLFRCAVSPSLLMVDVHHIIADGTSLKLLMQNLTAIYNGMNLSKPRIDFADYAAHYARMDFTEHRAFYKEFLGGFTETVSLPEIKRNWDPSTVICTFQLENDVIRYAKEAVGPDYSDTMMFFAAYAILMGRFSNKKEFLTSIILSNRTYWETEDVVGMFVNTVPVAVSIKGSTRQYLEEIRETIYNLMKYQELPFFSIASEVEGFNTGASDTIFIYQAEADSRLNLGGSNIKAERIDTRTAKVDLTFEIHPKETGVIVLMEFNPKKYDSKLMQRLYYAYRQILLQLSKEQVEQIEVLSENEQETLIDTFNTTHVEYPKEKCVHELFAEQAQLNSGNTALVFEGAKYTYRQLDEMSNIVASYLRAYGIGRNCAVPLISKRSWHLIVGMLGIIKAGGAYMPVDPTYPEDRINYMIESAEAKLALTYGYEGNVKIQTMSLENIDFNKTENIEEVPNVNTSEDICYIIFTSGSTGRPKGVAIAHRNACNFAYNAENNVVGKIITECDQTILAASTATFDMSITELMLPFMAGKTVCLANDEEMISQNGISNLFKTVPIDVIETTPTKMSLFLLDESNLDYIKNVHAIILGGEVFSIDLYRKLKKLTNARIYNNYGPTETTVWSTIKLIENEQDITIGKPIANTQIYVLGEGNLLQPVGVPGEICIAGDGVGKGYLNRPDLTKEKFVVNPFSTEENGYGTVMYRTGDLAYWRDDGELVYLGRIDTQVKIRGLRIELAEIENVMGCFPGIQLTAVVDRRDENGHQYLVGYYTAEEYIDESELKEHLLKILPKYMIPNYFVQMQKMPMTVSGKIDRKSLPTPDFSLAVHEYVPPVNDIERILCELAENILHMKPIGVTDDFFEMGGDSLRAIEYVAKAHANGIEFTLQNVFEYPTVRSMVIHLESMDESRIEYDRSLFEKYQPLLDINTIDEKWQPCRRGLGNILLTGCTGFLGVHILEQLITLEDGDIYCLVRGGERHLIETLHYYFGDVYDRFIGSRIHYVPGDITEVNESLENLDIQTVIHTAATVKHYGDYAYFERINVQGTRNMIEIARKNDAKFIHVSTASVSGNSFVDAYVERTSSQKITFTEQSLYEGQPLDNVYVHSKFESELVVLDAKLEGLDSVIVRVGNLTNRMRDYKFQKNYHTNMFLNRMKGCIELGVMPDYLLNNHIEFSPVDLTAEGIVKIAQYSHHHSVFHMYNYKHLEFGQLLDYLQKSGISVRVQKGEEFNQKMQDLLKNPDKEYLYRIFQNDFDQDGNLSYIHDIIVKCKFTAWFMRKIGFEWPEIDENYIEGYVSYFKELGYFDM